MGRHRSDPLGIARLALAGLAVLALLALIGVGAKALFSSLGPGGAPATGVPSTPPTAPQSPEPSESSPGKVPTIQLVCQADRCPVFVRVPGGDVLIDRDMTRGEQASYFNPELDVVLDDAGTVQVFENGAAQAPGVQGERKAFKVTRSPGQ